MSLYLAALIVSASTLIGFGTLDALAAKGIVHVGGDD